MYTCNYSSTGHTHTRAHTHTHTLFFSLSLSLKHTHTHSHTHINIYIYLYTKYIINTKQAHAAGWSEGHRVCWLQICVALQHLHLWYLYNSLSSMCPFNVYTHIHPSNMCPFMHTRSLICALSIHTYLLCTFDTYIPA